MVWYDFGRGTFMHSFYLVGWVGLLDLLYVFAVEVVYE